MRIYFFLFSVGLTGCATILNQPEPEKYMWVNEERGIVIADAADLHENVLKARGLRPANEKEWHETKRLDAECQGRSLYMTYRNGHSRTESNWEVKQTCLRAQGWEMELVRKPTAAQ